MGKGVSTFLQSLFVSVIHLASMRTTGWTLWMVDFSGSQPLGIRL
jgi:hypothetical protein